MQKTALCITGEERSLARNLRNIKATWLQTYAQSVDSFLVLSKVANETTTTRLLLLYIRPVDYLFFPEMKYPRNMACDDLAGNLSQCPSGCTRRAQAYWQAIKNRRCFELVVNHEHRKNFQYEHVAKIRPDAQWCFSHANAVAWISAMHRRPFSIWLQGLNGGKDGAIPTNVVGDNFALIPRAVAPIYFDADSIFGYCTHDDTWRKYCHVHRSMQNASLHTLECPLSMHLRRQNVSISALPSPPCYQLFRANNSTRFSCSCLAAETRHSHLNLHNAPLSFSHLASRFG